MRVKLLTTCLVQGGKRYERGDIFDVSEYVYNTHRTRFEKAEPEQVQLNESPVDEPEKPQAKKTPAKKKRTTRAAD